MGSERIAFWANLFIRLWKYIAAGTVWPDFAPSPLSSGRVRRANSAGKFLGVVAKSGLPNVALRAPRRGGGVWRRGESNPCFLRLRPRRSRNGFVREDSERVS